MLYTQVDSLLRERHRNHIPGRHLRIRPSVVRRREHKPYARVTGAVRLDLQLSMVRADFDYPIPEQDRSVPREDCAFEHFRILP